MTRIKEIAKEFTGQILDPATNSINFGLVTNMLIEIQHTQESVIKYGQLPDSAQTNRLYIFSPSFTAGIYKRALPELKPGKVINAVPEIQKGISLASLLDSHNRGRDLSPANQSSGDDSMNEKREKKKRRGLRM
ncbi:MAG: hypothetical protein ACOYXT_15580 [Bacteroidota bacterium]